MQINNQIIYAFLGFFAVVIAMVLKYSLSLENRTLKLEKKNGHEQHQIDQLKKKIEELERKDIYSDSLIRELKKENKELHEELQGLKATLQRYQRTNKRAIEY